MAVSKFAYVRNFELPDILLPETYIVLRIDGHSFHRQFKAFPRRLTYNLTLSFYRFSEDHEFAKPNDVRALQLMDEAASSVMESFADITLAFGESDEFRRVVSNPILCNETSAAEAPVRANLNQFLVQKIYERLQQTACENIDNGRIPVHILLRVQLDKAFPRNELEVPSVV